MNEEDILNAAATAEVEELLPEGYEYIIIDTKTLPNNGFATILRMDLKSKEEILKWLREYQHRNHITLRVLQTFEENTQKVVFKKEFRCVQNAIPRKGTTPRLLHTGCRAKVTTTLKNPNMKRSKDSLLKTHPCEIYIRHAHNHKLSRPPGLELEHQIKMLFEEGYSPTSALAIIKAELLQKYGEHYLESIPEGKRRLCERWVNEYYVSIYKQPYGDPVEVEMSEALEKIINEYNDKCGDVCAVINDQLIIAICSPLMKRIWQNIEEVGEVIYVHSSGNLDRHNTRIMLFLCPSPVGILPLGILFLPDESEENITEGVKLLNIILPSNYKVPKLMIVANIDERKCQVLRETFEIEEVLMCKFFIQKAVMRFLWDGKNSVHRSERVNIYLTFIKALNCLTEKDFDKTFDVLIGLTNVSHNNKVSKYFEELRACAPLWAMCYRQNRKWDTTDYWDVMFKVLKNNIPAKTLNIVQLFAYTASNFENYFFNKLKEIIKCEYSIPEQKKCWADKDRVRSSTLDCREIGYNLFSLVEKSKIHIVNHEIECCSCCVDKKGAPCKHKWAIMQAYDLNFKEIEYPVANDELRHLLKTILVDKECILNGWFDDNEQLIQLDFLENDDDDDVNENNKNVSEEESEEIIIQETIVKYEKAHTEEIINKLNQVMELIKEKLKSNPKQFNGPVEMFLNNFENCKTDKDLAAALETFGKKIETAETSIREEYPIKIESKKAIIPATPIVLQQVNNPVKIAPKQIVYTLTNKVQTPIFAIVQNSSVGIVPNNLQIVNSSNLGTENKAKSVNMNQDDVPVKKRKIYDGC